MPESPFTEGLATNRARAARRTLVVLAAVALSASARADAAPGSGDEAARRSTTDWFVLPAVFYLPETSVGFALSGGYHFGTDRGVQTSSLNAVGAYTLKHQASVSASAQVFAGESLAVTATGEYSLFPSHFFGIGNGATLDAEEAFTSRAGEIVLAPEVYVVPRRLRTGPNVALRAERFIRFAPGGRLGSGGVPGTSDYAYVGAGWSAAWDTRDSPFAPRRGELVEAAYLYVPGIGARPFGRGRIDARRFLELGGPHVLGLEGRLDVAHGDVPFTRLPRLGGGFGLRGYEEGRYRDRVAYTAQAEYRFPIRRRIGGAAFAGAGGVASTLRAIRLRDVRPAGGAGIRIRLTDDGVVLRADVAVGQDGANVYVVGMQAF